MNAISFTARLVDQPTIQHRASFFRYKEQEAAIVELECSSQSDMDALSNASSRWMKKGAKYADGISFEALYSDYVHATNWTPHYYALTTQTKNLEHIDSGNILGLMMFMERPQLSNEISLLEVNPSTCKSKNFFRRYKEVGKKLVQYVQTKYGQKDIDVFSDYTARDFYKKLGFAGTSKEVCELCWRAAR